MENRSLISGLDRGGECDGAIPYPSTSELFQGLGFSYATALYTYTSLVLVILAVEFLMLVRFFVAFVPGTRITATVWINSVFLVAALISFLGVALPKASEFVWLVYRVYLGLAMGYFIDLTLAWYGGESEMVRHLGEDSTINLRVRPCCLCFCCPIKSSLNKQKIRILRACVYQMPYVESAVVLFLAALNEADLVKIGDLSPRGPYLYLLVVIMTSFFLGVWALFSFLGVTNQYQLLSDNHYQVKSSLFRAVIILTNVQSAVIDSLANYQIIGCLNVLVSAKAMGAVIKCLLTTTECLVVGIITFRLNLKDIHHM